MGIFWAGGTLCCRAAQASSHTLRLLPFVVGLMPRTQLLYQRIIHYYLHEKKLPPFICHPPYPANTCSPPSYFSVRLSSHSPPLPNSRLPVLVHDPPTCLYSNSFSNSLLPPPPPPLLGARHCRIPIYAISSGATAPFAIVIATRF